MDGAAGEAQVGPQILRVLVEQFWPFADMQPGYLQAKNSAAIVKNVAVAQREIGGSLVTVEGREAAGDVEQVR